jgi:hypothetical protein
MGFNPNFTQGFNIQNVSDDGQIGWNILCNRHVKYRHTTWNNWQIKKYYKILYCSILLHFPLNYNQFSVLRANTCSSSHPHLKFLKLLKFLKVLKNTTCFGQYGHPQVLKFLVGETAIVRKQNRHLKITGSNTPSTPYVRIEWTHTIAAVSPTKNFNTWGWPYCPKHVVFLRTFKNKVLTILNVDVKNWQVFAHKTENWL